MFYDRFAFGYTFEPGEFDACIKLFVCLIETSALRARNRRTSLAHSFIHSLKAASEPNPDLQPT